MGELWLSQSEVYRVRKGRSRSSWNSAHVLGLIHWVQLGRKIQWKEINCRSLSVQENINHFWCPYSRQREKRISRIRGFTLAVRKYVVLLGKETTSGKTAVIWVTTWIPIGSSSVNLQVSELKTGQISKMKGEILEISTSKKNQYLCQVSESRHKFIQFLQFYGIWG